MPRPSCSLGAAAPAALVAAAAGIALAAAAPVRAQDAGEPGPDLAAPGPAAFDAFDLRTLRGYAGDQPGLDTITPGRWLPEPDGDDPWTLAVEAFGQHTDAGDLE